MSLYLYKTEDDGDIFDDNDYDDDDDEEDKSLCYLDCSCSVIDSSRAGGRLYTCSWSNEYIGNEGKGWDKFAENNKLILNNFLYQNVENEENI